MSFRIFGQDSPVNYSARDSIVADVQNQIVRLYGEANVQYEDFTLDAEYIEIDLTNNEVIATYGVDTTDSIIGKPLFNIAGEESRADYMKYNFETEKGYIREVRAQQDEGYIHMAEAKRHPNDEIHLKNGKFTTCDKEKPHYHFKLTKAIIVPDKRIVTGPVYMKLFKVPLPLAAPFGFFPNSESRKHGLILPSYGNTAQYGFGLQNIGYYIPLGDTWDTRFYGTIYTTGRFGLENQTNYYKKYKHRGNFGVKFEQFRGRFYDTTLINKWTIRWKHNQDAKAHPTIKFSTDINFKSDNNGKSSLEAMNSEYYDNQFNSAINVSKRWKTRKFSGTMGIKTSLQQNSVSESYTMDLPSFNLSVARFDLGVLRRNPIGESFLDKITVTYNMNARNFIQAPDSIFNADQLNLVTDYARNGIQHNTVVQSNLRLFGGRMTFTPNVTYKELWNFQYQQQAWDADSNDVITTEMDGFKSSRELSTRGSLVSNFYGYYRMIGKRKVRFRHVASPNVSFTYRPDIGLWQQIQNDSLGNTTYYSPFQSSLYREPGQGNSAFLTFSLNNTLEMKRRDMKDTINETTISSKLIDAFSLGGSYDFLKDSMNLSTISMAFRTSKFLNIFSFQSSAVLNPYDWDDTTGQTNKEYAWNSGKGIGRFTRANATVNANFTNKTGRKKQKQKDKETEDNAIANGNATNPNKPDFEIPWQINLSYNLNYNRQTIAAVDSFNLVQTIRADGDFNINKKWKIGLIVNYDLQEGAVTNYNVNIWRDLHCWEATFQWGQFGKWAPGGVVSATNITFLFRVNIKASMFQDIKLEYNQPPFFF